MDENKNIEEINKNSTEDQKSKTGAILGIIAGSFNIFFGLLFFLNIILVSLLNQIDWDSTKIAILTYYIIILTIVISVGIMIIILNINYLRTQKWKTLTGVLTIIFGGIIGIIGGIFILISNNESKKIE